MVVHHRLYQEWSWYGLKVTNSFSFAQDFHHFSTQSPTSQEISQVVGDSMWSPDSLGSLLARLQRSGFSVDVFCSLMI